MKPDQLMIVKLIKSIRFLFKKERPCQDVIKLGVTNFTLENNTFGFFPLCCLFASLKLRVKQENSASNMLLLLFQ